MLALLIGSFCTANNDFSTFDTGVNLRSRTLDNTNVEFVPSEFSIEDIQSHTLISSEDSNYRKKSSYSKDTDIPTLRELSGGSTSSGNSTSHSGHPNLFGNLTAITDTRGVLSILLIVVIILLLEQMFSILKETTEDTPFEEMIHAIQSEMMIVGAMAYAFKLMTSAGVELQEDWLFALEYADTVIPMTAFCFCAEGIVLVIMFMNQFVIWSTAYRLKLVEIFVSYYDHSHKSWMDKYFWLPIWAVNERMEFRIMHGIFCEQFNVDSHSFAFDEYVNKVLEKMLLDIVELQPVDWLMLIIMIFINWGRNALHLNIVHCHDTTDEVCMAEDSIELFVIIGGIKFAFTFVLAVVARYYELKIIRTKQLHTLTDYARYLKGVEKSTYDREHNRLTSHDMMTCVIRLKKKEALETHYAKHKDIGILRRGLRAIRHAVKCLTAFITRPCRRAAINPAGEGNSFVKSNKSTAGQSQIQKIQETRDIAGEVLTVDDLELGPATLDPNLSKSFEAGISADLSALFFLGSPDLFFSLIPLCSMVISFYLALWLTNFLQSSIYQLHSKSWAIISIIPSVLSFLCFSYVVKTAALLKAVIYADHECVEETIEQTEGSIALGAEVREKFLIRLKGVEDQEKELWKIFSRIDDNASAKLSRNEFQSFIESIGISFSLRKWHQIFREIDRNFDDEVSFNELFLFIFPDHEIAIEYEKNRLRPILDRVEHFMGKDDMLRRSSLSVSNKSLQSKKESSKLGLPQLSTIKFPSFANEGFSEKRHSLGVDGDYEDIEQHESASHKEAVSAVEKFLSDVDDGNEHVLGAPDKEVDISRPVQRQKSSKTDQV